MGKRNRSAWPQVGTGCIASSAGIAGGVGVEVGVPRKKVCSCSQLLLQLSDHPQPPRAGPGLPSMPQPPASLRPSCGLCVRRSFLLCRSFRAHHPAQQNSGHQRIEATGRAPRLALPSSGQTRIPLPSLPRAGRRANTQCHQLGDCSRRPATAAGPLCCRGNGLQTTPSPACRSGQHCTRACACAGEAGKPVCSTGTGLGVLSPLRGQRLILAVKQL